MVWFTQARQRKDVDNIPLGIWHLCAESDEGGGFFVGCDHDHKSAEEACYCLDARKRIGTITGFPLVIDKITINGQEHEWPHDDELSHEKICELAGQPAHASVIYCGPRKGDSQRSGMTYAGKTIKPDDDMIIDCVVTGSA